MTDGRWQMADGSRLATRGIPPSKNWNLQTHRLYHDLPCHFVGHHRNHPPISPLRCQPEWHQQATSDPLTSHLRSHSIYPPDWTQTSLAGWLPTASRGLPEDAMEPNAAASIRTETGLGTYEHKTRRQAVQGGAEPRCEIAARNQGFGTPITTLSISACKGQDYRHLLLRGCEPLALDRSRTPVTLGSRDSVAQPFWGEPGPATTRQAKPQSSRCVSVYTGKVTRGSIFTTRHPALAMDVGEFGANAENN